MTLIEHVTDYIRAWPPAAQIKLTREQYDEVKAGALTDDRPQWQRDPLDALIAVPIVVVDTVEKSTPHELGWLT